MCVMVGTPDLDWFGNCGLMNAGNNLHIKLLFEESNKYAQWAVNRGVNLILSHGTPIIDSFQCGKSYSYPPE